MRTYLQACIHTCMQMYIHRMYQWSLVAKKHAAGIKSTRRCSHTCTHMNVQQVALAITRCVAWGGDSVSLSFAQAPGLVEGLCKMKRDPEPFLRVAASAALQLLGRCDEACGINRKLLRAKWQNVLDVDQKTPQNIPESRHPGQVDTKAKQSNNQGESILFKSKGVRMCVPYRLCKHQTRAGDGA